MRLPGINEGSHQSMRSAEIPSGLHSTILGDADDVEDQSIFFSFFCFKSYIGTLIIVSVHDERGTGEMRVCGSNTIISFNKMTIFVLRHRYCTQTAKQLKDSQTAFVGDLWVVFCGEITNFVLSTIKSVDGVIIGKPARRSYTQCFHNVNLAERRTIWANGNRAKVRSDEQ